MSLLLILAVGQDPTILNTRANILRRSGYLVREAGSAAESIGLLNCSDFDLVLLCHTLPSEDRERIIRAIRSTGSRIPIFTVARGCGDSEDCLSDGQLLSNPAELIKGLSTALAARTREYSPSF